MVYNVKYVSLSYLTYRQASLKAAIIPMIATHRNTYAHIALGCKRLEACLRNTVF